uniref:LIM zinc-binding domain-containing protein n=1 Tax=Steinernema glaseri TaxID=37863 RepID=A0A1I8AMW5_9BILA
MTGTPTAGCCCCAAANDSISVVAADPRPIDDASHHRRRRRRCRRRCGCSVVLHSPPALQPSAHQQTIVSISSAHRLVPSASSPWVSASFRGKKCYICKKKCTGDIFKTEEEKFIHIACFQCKKCSRPLSETGFFTSPDGTFLCPDDYRSIATPLNVLAEQPKVERHEELPSPPLASPTACAACDQPLHTGQVLLALDQSWHVWCFKCAECDVVLQGEYMTHEGKPLCLRDYNLKHGVKCYECDKFIAGKVLQAGIYKFHPTCARCSRCGNHFGDGAEMYMQGDEIWHPDCEHSRVTENLAPSPKNGSLRARPGPKYQTQFGQHLTYMYLLPEAEQTYLKHPIAPHPPQPAQFHTPQAPIKIRKSRLSMLKTGMQRLAEDLERSTPRAKSPHMDNEEPIEMAHYPAGHAPAPDDIPAIERDDFPAPPYPYAVEELKRRLSSSSIENDDDEDDYSDGGRIDEEKIKKNVEQLDKFDKDSSIAHVIKQNIEESQKKQRQLKLCLDKTNPF